MNAGLCVVFAGMVLNVIKGLCGRHFPSEGNVNTDNLDQHFSIKSIIHGNHKKWKLMCLFENILWMVQKYENLCSDS